MKALKTKLDIFLDLYNSQCKSKKPGLRAQTLLREVVEPCYQHCGCVDNKVSQLRATKSQPLDYNKLSNSHHIYNKTALHIVHSFLTSLEVELCSLNTV